MVGRADGGAVREEKKRRKRRRGRAGRGRGRSPFLPLSCFFVDAPKGRGARLPPQHPAPPPSGLPVHLPHPSQPGLGSRQAVRAWVRASKKKRHWGHRSRRRSSLFLSPPAHDGRPAGRPHFGPVPGTPGTVHELLRAGTVSAAQQREGEKEEKERGRALFARAAPPRVSRARPRSLALAHPLPLRALLLPLAAPPPTTRPTTTTTPPPRPTMKHPAP